MPLRFGRFGCFPSLLVFQDRNCCTRRPWFCPSREQPYCLMPSLFPKVQTAEPRPEASLNIPPSLFPVSVTRPHKKKPLTLNLKSSWLAEPFMVKDWEMLQGERSKDGSSVPNSLQKAGTTGPADSLSHLLLPSSLFSWNDQSLHSLVMSKRHPAPPTKAWAPQKSSGRALFICATLRGPMNGIRHRGPAIATSGSARLGAHLPSEARLNSETSSSVLV